MSQPARTSELKNWTAAELRALPPAQRDAVLAAASAAAEHDYRTNADLTRFDAFDGDNLNGESADAETR